MPQICHYYDPRKIFSIFLPFACSSTNLSKYRTCCVKGCSISSTRYPQMTPVMSVALGCSEARWKNVSKVTFSFISSCSCLLSNPVNHCMTWCNSSFVLPFFSTFARYKGRWLQEARPGQIVEVLFSVILYE